MLMTGWWAPRKPVVSARRVESCRILPEPDPDHQISLVTHDCKGSLTWCSLMDIAGDMQELNFATTGVPEGVPEMTMANYESVYQTDRQIVR